MSTPIVVEGLTKRFGSFEAVTDVTFTAPAGAITALLGPSGSGKSTVLRMIAGLEEPTSGRIVMGGEELTVKSVQERRVGFVFQHYALFRHMSVADNVAFGLRVRKEAKDVREERVRDLLELVHLAPFADRYPDQLSGGQRQRVALARALAPQPKVLLLDEPFGALDAKVRQDLRRWLDELHRELGVTSLLVTHDQEEALELANQVVVMHEGRVEQVGSPKEIYDDPVTAFVAGFVGSANVLHGEVVDGHVRLGSFRLPGAGHLEEGTAAAASSARTTSACPRATGTRRPSSNASRRSGGSPASRCAWPTATWSWRTCRTTSCTGRPRAPRSASICGTRRRSDWPTACRRRRTPTPSAEGRVSGRGRRRVP